MSLRSVVLLILVASSSTALAQKIPDDFRTAFEAVWKQDRYKGVIKGTRKRVSDGTYAVVRDHGVPASSIYGRTLMLGGDGTYYRMEAGEPTRRYQSYPVDIVQGKLQPGKQEKEHLPCTLARGEVVRVLDISYQDNRIDLQVEARTRCEVKRGTTSNYEEVSTRYRFALPGPGKAGAADVPAGLASIEAHLKPFPDEASAQAWATTERFKPLPGAKPWPATLNRDKAVAALQAYEASVPPRPRLPSNNAVFEKENTLAYLQMALDDCDAGEASGCDVMAKLRS